jgi:tRNA-modifying protein YgfZ
MSSVTIDRSSWGRLRVTGSDRVRFLQGLTTVNVETLADGAHAWGAILNPKGRLLTVIDIAHLGDAFVIACEGSLADKTRQLLERYAVMDDVTFEPITAPAHQTWDDPVGVWRAPIVEGGADGGAVVDELDPRAERLRIRAGFPRYGADVGEDHFPFETPLAQFLDYQKGCYVGQEPVFRVHAQGGAARALRGLVIEGDAPIAAGTQIQHAARENAGTVTSTVAGDDGTIWALGYLHRTVWDVGGAVTVAGRPAAVRELPW